MNVFKRIPALIFFAAALTLGACSQQDETMDEIISKTEISAPVDASEDEGTKKAKDTSEADEPGARLIN